MNIFLSSGVVVFKKIYLYLTLAAVIALGAAQSAQAQNKIKAGQISGTIIDSVSKQPAGFATVSLKTEKDSLLKTTLSKTDGKFKFENLRPAAYHLVVVSTGYKRTITRINLTNTTEINLTIGLARDTKSLKEVQITADKPLVRQKADRIIYDMQADPESKVTNVLGMIHKIPFLSVDGDDNILMKGNASFKVLVNGKESGMFTNNLKEILKGMPASSVVSIEVITIPPAKYDGEGLAGIINIITNRKVAGGYKGNFNIREGFPNGGPGVGGSITAQEGKFGVNAFGGASSYTNSQTSFSHIRSAIGNNASILKQNGYNNGDGKNGYFGTELSYEIDSLNLLSGNFNINGSRNGGFVTQSSQLADATGALTEAYQLDNNNHSNRNGLDASLNYQLGFKADKNTLLTFSYRYSQYGGNSLANIDISNRLGYPTPDYRQTNNDESREHTVQIDYARKLHKINMEAGVKAIFRRSNSDFESLLADSAGSQFVNDPTMGNTFNYAQDVFGAYNSYGLSIKKWNFSAGLRAEETYVNAKFISTGTFVDRTYINVLPSFSVSHQFAGNSNLNFGFAQRIQRSSINRLNPFVDRSNPDFIVTGNPKLRPVVMNNVQLGYTTTIGKNLSVFVATDYTFFNDLDLAVTLFDPTTQISTTTYENNGKGGGAGLNFNLNYSPVKFYSLGINGNAMQFFVDGKGDIAADRLHLFTARISLTNSFKFNGGWSANLNGEYQGRSPRSIQGVTNAYFSTSISVNKVLIKNKLYISGALRNPFTKFRNNLVTTTSTDFLQLDENQRYFRFTTFSLNYNFGRLKSDIKKNRKGINNDDTGGGL